MSDTLTTQSATPATVPANTVIATDDAGAAGHVQIVKLAVSADGDATPITADANGIAMQGAGAAGTPAGGVVSVQGVASGTNLPISAASLPLPSGAATAAHQSTANTSLASILTELQGKADLVETQPVSVASLPLPTGASTLAEQQSQTTHLATIAGDTTDIETAVELLDDAVATTGSAIPSKGFAVSGTDGTNARILKTDASGELQVDVLTMPTTTVQGTVTIQDGGNTITVDGTVAVSGTVTVDGSGATQPISHAALTELGAAIDTEVQVDVVGALPAGDNNIGNVDVVSSALPTGAATAANQSTANTALSAIQTAVEAMDEWDESDRAKVNPIVGEAGVQGGSGAVSATTQRVVLATDVALPAGTNAIGKLAANSGVDIGDVDVTSVPTDPFGANADAASATGSISAKLRFIASTGIPITGTVTVGSHAVTNAGTFATQVDGAALTALQLIDDPVLTDDAAFTPATSKVMMAGFEADEASTDSVDEGDAGAARMTLDRKQIVNPQPHTTGGLSIFRSLDLNESEEQVKATAGQVYGVWFTNTATTTRWLKFYNDTAANVTVGSTTPVITLALPGNSSDDISGVFGMTHGIAFDTAITVACTTGVADADTGAPSANDCIVNVFYK